MAWDEKGDLEKYWPGFSNNNLNLARLNGCVCIAFYFRELRKRGLIDKSKKIQTSSHSPSNVAKILSEVISDEYCLQTSLISKLARYMQNTAKDLESNCIDNDSQCNDALLETLLKNDCKGLFPVYAEKNAPAVISETFNLDTKGIELFEFIEKNKKHFKNGLLSIRFNNIILDLMKKDVIPEGIMNSEPHCFIEKRILIDTVLLSLLLSVGKVDKHIGRHRFSIPLCADSIGRLANIPLISIASENDLAIFGEVENFRRIFTEATPIFTNGYGISIYSIRNDCELFYAPDTEDQCLSCALIIYGQWVTERIKNGPGKQIVIIGKVCEGADETIQTSTGNSAINIRDSKDLDILRRFGSDTVVDVTNRAKSIAYAKTVSEYMSRNNNRSPFDLIIIDCLVKEVESISGCKWEDLVHNEERVKSKEY